MHKVDERVELSKRVLDIDVKSPIFAEMLDNLDQQIKMTIKKVYDKNFVGGEINLKLSLQIPEAYKDFPYTDADTGEILQKTYMYRQLRFAHKVTGTLKKQYVSEGTFDEEREIKENDDGSFSVVPLESPQISMDEL